MKIEFIGIPPSKKNSKQVFCRGGRPTVLPSKGYLKWHEEQEELLKTIKKVSGLNEFNYYFYIPLNKDGTQSKRPFDFTNKIESIQDLLVDLDIIEDDNYYFMIPKVVGYEFVPFGEGKVEVNIQNVK